MGNFYETIAEEVEKLNQTRIKACPMLKRMGSIGVSVMMSGLVVNV